MILVFYSDTIAGAFTIIGRNIVIEYVYKNYTLTVKTGTLLTVSRATDNDRVEVKDGITAKLKSALIDLHC